MFHKLFSLLLVASYSITAVGQDVLLDEKFDECSLPSDWTLAVTNAQDAGVTFGYMYNPNSDSLTIDGSCMVVFDDDILGNNMPSFKAELKSPILNVQDYSSIDLSMDIAFRAYGSSSLELFIIANEEYISIARYDEGDGTGASFSQAIDFTSDLSFVTDASEIQIAIVYDDDNIYAWYAGIDNVKVVGENKGEIVIQEDFNACEIPEGWESEIIGGEEAWVFGYVENSNTSSTSMNGSCFAYFDDDGIGQDVPFSTVELRTPVFDGSEFAEYVIDFDLIFRKAADFENISVYVFNGTNYTLVEEFILEVGGTSFTNFKSISLDLTQYRSTQMQVAFRYEDGDAWGWWVGIDNVKISGKGDINDICSKALPLLVNQACAPVSNRIAVNSGPAASCADEIAHTLWYTFTADYSGILQIDNSTDFNDLITIYSGTCQDLVELDCVNADEHGFEGERVLLDLQVGQTILIRVASVIRKYGATSGFTCLSASWLQAIPDPVLHDMSTSALKLEVGEDCIPFANIQAKMSQHLPIDNELARADVWCYFDCQESGDYLVETNADFSESIVVFQTVDGEMMEIGANHYGQSLELVDAVQGEQYFIQVSGLFSTIEGGACLKIIEQQKDDPLADDCQSAQSIEVDEIIDISNQWNTFSGIYPSCNVYSSNDYWLTFQAKTSTIYIGTDAVFPATLAVYTGQCNDLEEVWCSENQVFCDGYMQVNGLEVNEEYLIQIVSNYTYDDLEAGTMSIKLMENIEDELEPLTMLVNEICQDGTMAQLEIIVNGGSGQYTISGYQSEELLFAGEAYLIVVTDSSGCEISRSGVVGCQSTNCNLIANAAIMNLECFNSSEGSIDLTIENATEPLTYLWNEDSLSGANPTSLEQGSYSVTITDAEQCVTIEEFLITEPAELFLELNKIDESAQNANDGFASVDISGGVFPYSYAWNNGSTDTSVDNLEPGNYSVTVTDGFGCSVVKAFSIKAFECLFDLSIEIQDLSCFASESGSISLISNTEQEIVQVMWNNDLQGAEIQNLEAGIYTATITLADGCQSIEEYAVEQPEQFEITELINEDVRCFGEATGIIDLTIDGGTGTKTVLWPDGTESTSRDDLVSGTYELTVTDDNNCTTIFEVEMNEPPILEVASFMTTDPLCYNDQNGTICIFIDGGVEPYDFDWGDALPAMSKLENVGSGNYPLTVYDINGCDLNTEVNLNNPSEILVSLTSVSVDESNPSLSTIDISVNGGTGNYTFLWTLEGEVVSIIEDPEELVNGLYTVVVTDANGCTKSLDVLVDYTSLIEFDGITVELYPNPAVDHTQLIFSNENFSQLSFQVFSSNGKLMESRSKILTQTTDVDLARYPSGVYYIEVRNGDELGAIQFVKVQ